MKIFNIGDRVLYKDEYSETADTGTVCEIPPEFVSPSMEKAVETGARVWADWDGDGCKLYCDARNVSHLEIQYDPTQQGETDDDI